MLSAHASPHACVRCYTPAGRRETFPARATGLLVEGSFGSVPLFMREASGVVVGAYDDMAYGVTPVDPTQLHRSPLIRGRARFGPRHIAAESCAEAATHAVTAS